MLNNVIAGIAIALNQEFGDDYEIYTEEIKQDLKEPCFFITLLNPSKTDSIQTVFDGQSILYTVFPEIGGQSE